MTNDDARMTKEARMSKHEYETRGIEPWLFVGYLGCTHIILRPSSAFRASAFFRHSCVVIRHSPENCNQESL